MESKNKNQQKDESMRKNRQFQYLFTFIYLFFVELIEEKKGDDIIVMTLAKIGNKFHEKLVFAFDSRTQIHLSVTNEQKID